MEHEPETTRGDALHGARTPGAVAGMRFKHHFAGSGVHPFDAIEWELRTATITSDRGEIIFEQEGVEVPSFWSQLATNVVVSKYFAGPLGTPRRETSVRQLVTRAAHTLRLWGEADQYFATPEDAEVFERELTHLLVNQHAAFNSPVWFNMGIDKEPQCSACFINAVEDSMESILDLAKTEGLLFKYGSGTGTNFSPLRGSQENLTGGGIASGPVSFMRGFDAFAGVIKSGGKTRRSAKMVILDCDHPDIEEFIACKATEERKAWSLIEAGYEGGISGEAYASVFFQNANNSVRVTDLFMEKAEEHASWDLVARTSGDPIARVNAHDLLWSMAEGAHFCGDPGIQFDTTINVWNTCADTARINASNPCSEYMFLDNSACNLASLNLMRFRRRDRSFDVEGFRQAVRLMITAMDIIVDRSSYPTEKITRNSHHYRPLGLGYANLGALLMSRGAAYDSDEGRATAAAITALMSGEAYRTSSELAERVGPSAAFAGNEGSFLRVIQRHREALADIDSTRVAEDLLAGAQIVWDEALEQGKESGYRNCQVTVLAPTGTIAFFMDCDTTGIEPDIALVKYKKLAGGGMLKLVNNTVPEALEHLGYNEAEASDIHAYIEHHDTIEGAPCLREEHLTVFDCALKPINGKRSIHHRGHLRMMAAAQPFLSGAISKTVNMPQETTVEEIYDLYMEAWKLGLKAVAIYRDGSKRVQPVSTRGKEGEAGVGPGEAAGKAPPQVVRRRLPDERQSITHKFSVAGHKGYITVGMFEDGSPGEIFITMSKEGSTVSGLMDGFATAISMALQYGVPVKVLVNKFSHMRFEPSGFTGNTDIPMAKSILDYIFRWLGRKFLPPHEQAEFMHVTGLGEDSEVAAVAAPPPISPVTREQRTAMEARVFQNHADAPPCPECGQIMVRNGACYKCLECGATSGCS